MTLIGWWPLHDDSAQDYSGNGNHGTPNGSPTTGVAGKAGLQATSFNGSDDYISGVGNQDRDYLTLSVWIRPDSLPSSGERTVIWHGNAGTTEDNFGLTYEDDRFRFSFQPSSGNINVYGGTPSQNEWTHLAMTWDGDTAIGYVNGESVVRSTSESGELVSNSSNRLQIGAYDDDSSSWVENVDGSICDLRVYNSALSQSEIQTLYESGSADLASPPTDGVARYKLDGDATDTWETTAAQRTEVSRTPRTQSVGRRRPSMEPTTG